jgi:hypothetical protein
MPCKKTGKQKIVWDVVHDMYDIKIMISMLSLRHFH